MFKRELIHVLYSTCDAKRLVKYERLSVWKNNIKHVDVCNKIFDDFAVLTLNFVNEENQASRYIV